MIIYLQVPTSSGGFGVWGVFLFLGFFFFPYPTKSFLFSCHLFLFPVSQCEEPKNLSPPALRTLPSPVSSPYRPFPLYFPPLLKGPPHYPSSLPPPSQKAPFKVVLHSFPKTVPYPEEIFCRVEAPLSW